MLSSHLQRHYWVGVLSGLPFYLFPFLTLFKAVSSISGQFVSGSSAAEEHCHLTPQWSWGLLDRKRLRTRAGWELPRWPLPRVLLLIAIPQSRPGVWFLLNVAFIAS